MKFHKFVTAIAKCRCDICCEVGLNEAQSLTLSFVWGVWGSMPFRMPVCAQTTCRQSCGAWLVPVHQSCTFCCMSLSLCVCLAVYAIS